MGYLRYIDPADSCFCVLQHGLLSSFVKWWCVRWFVRRTSSGTISTTWTNAWTSLWTPSSPRCPIWSRICTRMTSATSWCWCTGVCICFHMFVLSVVACLCDGYIPICRIQVSSAHSLRAHTGRMMKGWRETFLLKTLKEKHSLGGWDTRPCYSQMRLTEHIITTLFSADRRKRSGFISIKILHLSLQVWPGLTAYPDFSDDATHEWWYDNLQKFHEKVPFDGLWIVSGYNWGTNFNDYYNDSLRSTSSPWASSRLFLGHEWAVKFPGWFYKWLSIEQSWKSSLHTRWEMRLSHTYHTANINTIT